MGPDELIGRFIEHLVRMQFDKARELADLEKMRTNWVDFSSLDERHWPALMTVLAQLANLESAYFSLSYMLSKFSFRKENNIRDIYAQMKLELSRIASAEKGQFPSEETMAKTAPVPKLAAKFARFVSIRANLVELYTLLPVKDWRAFEEECFLALGTKFSTEIEACCRQIEAGNSNNQPDLFMPCRNEFNALSFLLGAQRAIQECNALDALLMLKRCRDLLDDWFCSLDASSAAKPSAPSSFFLAFSSRRRSSISRLGLLQFLLHFYQTMVAKFSLYFYDTLVPFVPHGEMKQAFSSPASFLQVFSNFARKTNAQNVCLLLNRIDQEKPFRGFGYHYEASTQNLAEGEKPHLPEEQPMKTTTQVGTKKDLHSGLHQKYPALLFIPAERRHDHNQYATICSFVQEGCANGGGNGGTGSGTISTSNANLATESSTSGKIRYLYDKNKEQIGINELISLSPLHFKSFFTACVEANIHLVVTFERRVQERESAVLAFFAEALGGIRCTKLFQEIKNIGK